MRVARVDVVGSLLRPAYLKEACQGARAGTGEQEAKLRLVGAVARRVWPA